MKTSARIFALSALAVLISSCGSAPTVGDASKSNGAQNLTSTPADSTADYVLSAEKYWSKNDRANTVEMYNKAILSATKEGNPVQAQIFAKRLEQIEKTK